MNGDFHVADDGVGFHIGDNLFFLGKTARKKLREERASEELAANQKASSPDETE